MSSSNSQQPPAARSRLAFSSGQKAADAHAVLNRRTPKRKTLIFCPIGLGNYLMAAPSLKRLSEEIGPENLHLLALKPGIRQMGEAGGYFSRVHFCDPDKQGKGAVLKTLMGLRRERYDFSIGLFPTSNLGFTAFALLTGAKTRIGFQYPHEKLPIPSLSKIFPLNWEAHDTDQNYDLIEALIGSVDGGARRIEFPYTPRHPQAEALAREHYYVCHPGSSAERGMQEKRLPPAMFAAIIRRIHREFGLKCQLIGGLEEADLRAEIAKGAPDAVLQYSSASLEELAGLIEPARFYLGNDSGLMHICVGLRKRCIAFFGPTDDKRNGPYSDALRRGEKGEHLIVRRDDLQCSPCWTIHTVGANPPCIYGDTRCLKSMGIESVWPKIQVYVYDVMKTSPEIVLSS